LGFFGDSIRPRTETPLDAEKFVGFSLHCVDNKGGFCVNSFVRQAVNRKSGTIQLTEQSEDQGNVHG
jgi:HJR/Mrr/RecB family endonuclease